MGEYREYKEFKRRVLIPIQKDLEGNSDSWFNCNVPGFEIRRGKSVSLLNFKIVVPAAPNVINTRVDYLLHIFRTHFSFDENNCKSIYNLLVRIVAYENAYVALIEKATSLNRYINQNIKAGQRITNIPRYISTSINTWAKDEKYIED